MLRDIRMKMLRCWDAGKQQANMTGYRLKMWNLTFDRIIHSNAVRAVQTADIIKQHLEGVPVSVDSILTEGGPVPPKPTISYWGLPERVCDTCVTLTLSSVTCHLC